MEDISEVVFTSDDHEGNLQIEYDDITMKTKSLLTRLVGTFGTLRFNERSFLILFWVLHLIGIRNQPMQFMLIPRVYILEIKF